MVYKINTLAEYLDACGEDQCVCRKEVNPRVLDCKVWVAMVSMPGCMPHAYATFRGRKAAGDYLKDYAGGIRRLAIAPLLALTNAPRKEGCAYVDGLAYELVSMRVREQF